MSQPLPIDALRPALAEACGRTRRIVLRAPTGSGKSTRLPQMLVDLGLTQGQVLVLQPRRIAARMLAARIAQERGCRLGGEVGYQVRFDRAESAETRIKFITEALLLRQVASDPSLRGIGAVVFDEFHERSLHSDVGLALARRIQESGRPDLIIVVMSATLDTEGVARWLEGAETLAADGRTYPVEIEHLHVPRDSRRPVWDLAAEQVGRVLREEPDGDVLVFMPGSYEIMRTIGAVRALSESGGVDVLPLHGELPPEEQQCGLGQVHPADLGRVAQGTRLVIRARPEAHAKPGARATGTSGALLRGRPGDRLDHQRVDAAMRIETGDPGQPGVDHRADAVEQDEGSDFFVRLALLRRAAELKFDADACERLGVHGLTARQADQAARQFLRIAEGQRLPVSAAPAASASVRRCVLMGFSDRLAVRLDAGTLRCAVVHGRKGELRRESSVRSARLLVAAEIDEIQARGEVTTYLSLCTAVEEAWLRELWPDDFSEQSSFRYDGTQRRVMARTERRFRDLVLEHAERDAAPSDEASRLLAEEALAGRLQFEKWDAQVDAWIRRVNFLARHCPELGVHPFDAAARRMVIEELCAGAVSAREVRERPVLPSVRGWITHEQAMALDSYCPERIVLPRKKHPARIEYTEDGQAEIEATVQELYDFPGSRLRVCDGKVPLVVCIQSPARRTQQRTTDLDAFWKGSYEGVKKELRGRYPRHEWR
ncbi:MAG: ATP-dependent helicase C-terminal domain-containing protein [Verrucomicrobiota bacterium]